MPSPLTVQINPDERGARLMRGTAQIGSFELDEHFQLQAITIGSSAAPTEREQIIRLAASHVAQYCVTGRSFHQTMAGGLLRATRRTMIPGLPGMTRERSRELLDFDNLPAQHARMSAAQLQEVLTQVGVRITQR
jgi:hypothetical protein